jgi:nucleoside-diphosphate-sugar epimerase
MQLLSALPFLSSIIMSVYAKKAFVVGGTGGVGSLLTDLLVKNSYQVSATYRKPVDESKIKAQGATPIQLDLESATAEELKGKLEGFNQVFFTAGGGGKNVEKIDRDGAIKIANSIVAIDSSNPHSIMKPHLILLSSIGVDQLDKLPKELYEYGKAKKEADDAILGMKNKLKTTILRPGGLTDKDAAGKAIVRQTTTADDSILTKFEMKNVRNSRADVARVLIQCAEVFAGDSESRVVEMVEGNDMDPGNDIRQALGNVLTNGSQ